MKNGELIERIVLNPKVMVGKPVIRGTRLTVDFILNLLAHGRRHPRLLSRLLEAYPDKITDSSLYLK
jgi:uncharacterized protein (DUF433 family)